MPAKAGIQTAVGGCFLDPAFAGVTSCIVAVSPPPAMVRRVGMLRPSQVLRHDTAWTFRHALCAQPHREMPHSLWVPACMINLSDRP